MRRFKRKDMKMGDMIKAKIFGKPKEHTIQSKINAGKISYP